MIIRVSGWQRWPCCMLCCNIHIALYVLLVDFSFSRDTCNMYLPSSFGLDPCEHLRRCLCALRAFVNKYLFNIAPVPKAARTAADVMKIMRPQSPSSSAMCILYYIKRELPNQQNCVKRKCSAGKKVPKSWRASSCLCVLVAKYRFLYSMSTVKTTKYYIFYTENTTKGKKLDNHIKIVPMQPSFLKA